MDSEMKMNMRTSITNQTLRRLLLATLLSVLVAGCGSGTISSTGSSLSGDTLIGGGGTGGGTGTGTGTGTGSGTGTGGTALQNGVPAMVPDAPSGTELHYTIDVPAGASNLNFQLSASSGDADLYVRYAAAPTVNTFDCRPYLNGSSEYCAMPSATAGTWHVMVVSYSDVTNVSLLVSYTVGGAGTGSGTGTGGTSVSCTGTSTGLAAEDLAGQCRAAPQATMGALEAVSG